MDIQVGQHWKTRSGDIVRVTKDRTEFDEGNRWRWALSNGEIVDEDGQANINKQATHPSDLIKLLPDEKVSDASMKAMDSTMGKL